MTLHRAAFSDTIRGCSMGNSDSFRLKKGLGIWFAWTLIVVGLLCFMYGYTAFIGKQYLLQVDRNDLAALGSFLQGTVGSLWSLAAFVFIYVAFLGQQEELQHNRDDAARQERTAVQQRFENSFFALLGLHRQLRTEITIKNPNNPNELVHGKRAISS